MNRIFKTIALVALTAGISGTLVWQASAHQKTGELQPRDVVANLPAGQDNPMIANGVRIGSYVATYKSSGTGPKDLNTTAPADSEERYIDPKQFPDGNLTEGVTITEAQALNALARLGENLESVGLGYQDVIAMRVFLVPPKGAETADYAGWNRAYRQYFANVDLKTKQPVSVPLGTAAPKPPLVSNNSRPARTAIEVGSLPRAGWLVEIDVEAAIPQRKS